jgi:hypothetical protein
MMHSWLNPVSLVGMFSTTVVCGTDMFFSSSADPLSELRQQKQEPK